MTEPDPTRDPAVDEPSETRRALRSMLVTFVAAVFVIVAAGGVGFAMRHNAPMYPAGQPAMAGFMLSSVSPEMASHYHFADAHPSMYEQVPCFCGCDTMLGHRSLLDCFVKPDGSGWESHASGCAVCTQESQMIRRMLDRGIPPDQIASSIIAHYDGGITAS